MEKQAVPDGWRKLYRFSRLRPDVRGYKDLNQGTYYSYFKPQFAAFGIDCDMLNWTVTYSKPNHTNHDRALELLKQEYSLRKLDYQRLFYCSMVG